MMQTDKLIYDSSLIEILPDFLKKDETLLPILEVIAEELTELLMLSKKVSFLGRINELSETELDLLAHDLNVKWYDASASIDVKRRVISGCDYIHRHLASVGVVERLFSSFFGDTSVSEWIDYDGKPCGFKLHITNPEGYSAEKAKHVLSFGKKGTARLEETTLDTSTKGEARFGVVLTRKRKCQFEMCTEVLAAADDVVIIDDEGTAVLAY